MGRRGLAVLVDGEAWWLVTRDGFADPLAAVFLLIMGSTLLCSVSGRSRLYLLLAWGEGRVMPAGDILFSMRLKCIEQTGFPTTAEAPHFGTPQTGLASESSLLSGVMVVRAILQGHSEARRGSSDSVARVEDQAALS